MTVEIIEWDHFLMENRGVVFTTSTPPAEWIGLTDDEIIGKEVRVAGVMRKVIGVERFMAFRNKPVRADGPGASIGVLFEV